MNYGKIADGIAATLVVVCLVVVVACLVVLWVIGPLIVSIPVTLFMLAVAAVVVLSELDRRGA